LKSSGASEAAMPKTRISLRWHIDTLM
jgi:hypothetical protein